MFCIEFLKIQILFIFLDSLSPIRCPPKQTSLTIYLAYIKHNRWAILMMPMQGLGLCSTRTLHVSHWDDVSTWGYVERGTRGNATRWQLPWPTALTGTNWQLGCGLQHTHTSTHAQDIPICAHTVHPYNLRHSSTANLNMPALSIVMQQVSTCMIALPLLRSDEWHCNDYITAQLIT